MRNDWADTSSDPNVERNISVTAYSSATWADVITGAIDDLVGDALATFVTRGSISSRQASITIRWPTGIAITVPPRPGTLVVFRDEVTGQILWAGSMDSIEELRESRGERFWTITLRSRDATAFWRRNRWTTDVYPVGTDLAVIVIDILKALGLTPPEYPAVQVTGRPTPHTSTQLADMTAWNMFETLGLPCGTEPMVDAIGRFKLISREVTRRPDLTLSREEVISVSRSWPEPPVTALCLSWLDHNLVKSQQQDQVLATESLTAGFFKLKQERKTYWSDDRYQRAEHTYMKVKASVNDGLISVGSERYEQKDLFHGEITVQTDSWVPALATAMLAVILVSSMIPDLVIALFGGVTVPLGRIIQAIAEIAVLIILMSLGSGKYEIWGQPFDYVHPVHKTEAFDKDAQLWERVNDDISSDFVTDEGHAQSFAIRELLYRSLSARRMSITIVDRPAIERGDILAIPGPHRMYVLDYRRDITRGAKALLQVEGFQV